MSELQELSNRVAELELAMALRLPDRDDMAIRKLLGAVHYRTNSVRMLGILLKREFMSFEGMSLALRGATRASMKTCLHKLRKVLKPHDIAIETIPEGGLRMNRRAKARLRALLNTIAEAA